MKKETKIKIFKLVKYIPKIGFIVILYTLLKHVVDFNTYYDENSIPEPSISNFKLMMLLTTFSGIYFFVKIFEIVINLYEKCVEHFINN